ncbi:NTP/NDP exchange transporter [Dyella lutea]|uniref:MFS transporter n=1 Tax=Dyella lutea TaxID=2950441 RepID=A0ABT1F7X4_9GAMM|nr:MFS transporter [Dyella lutea]MCP1373446.1 MFS transporter [Dyella lutea]
MSASPHHAARLGTASALSALAFFFLMTSYYIIRPVMNQLGGAVGSQSLPLFYGAVFVVMLALTPVFGLLVARFPRRPLLCWSYSFFILCLLAFVPAFLAQDRLGARNLGVVFFVWVSVFNLFVVSLFWSFMADIFSSVEARKAFSLIALGGMGGAIFGPLLTKLLLQLIGVPPLLLVSALALGASLGLLLLLSARDRREPQSRGDQVIGGSLWAGLRAVWAQPFMRYMALLMLFGDGIGTLAYALVADYAKAHFAGVVARTAFYNNLDLATNTLGAVLQLSATRWLLIRLGPGWGLVVPSVVNVLLLVALALAGSDGSVVVFGSSVSLLALTMVITRGFAYGMTKPATDALYTRVSRENRYKGKNFVETAVWRFGDVVVTSAVSGLRLLGLGVGGLALLGAGVASMATWVATRAGWSADLAPDEPAGPGTDGTAAG